MITQGKLIRIEGAHETWFEVEAAKLPLTCVGCGKKLKAGDTIHWAEDSGDVYCNDDDKRCLLKYWKPHHTPAYQELIAWKCILTKKKERDKNGNR